MSKKYGRALLASGLAGALKESATTVIACVFSAMVPGVATAQAAEDSAAIRAQVEAYQNAWNRHDPVAVAAFFAEDGDFVMGNLPEVHGRQAIENWWRDFWQSKFNRQEPERKGTFILNSIRFIADDVALANIKTKTGGRDSLGVELRARRARGTWVLHRQNDNWLISAIRGMPTEEDSVALVASFETAESLRPHIRAFVDAYEDAFNSHASAVSAFFRNDADIIVRNSSLLQGKQAIQDWWSAYFSKRRPYRALFIIDEIRTISDDVAQVNFTVTGAILGTENESRPLRQTRAMWVLVREAGGWHIAALRVLQSEEDRIIRESGR